MYFGRNMPRLISRGTFLLLALISWRGTVFAQASGASIVGQVRVAPGLDLPKPVLVSLESHGMIVNTVYTDGEGRFGFNDLPGNIYHLKIGDENYLPVDEVMAVDPETNAGRMVNIFLSPRHPEQAEASAITGGNPNLTNSAELRKLYPTAALKEFDAGVKADEKNDTDNAIKHYQKALKIAPDMYPARNNLGTAYLAKGMVGPAGEEFQKAIGLNANDAAAYFNLGNLHYLQRDFSVAKDWVEQGLSKEPASAFGHFLRGSTATAVGDFSLAEKELRRSLELDEKLAKAHLALVNLYLRQQRKPEAVTELHTFLKTFPKDPWAPKASEVLKKLESAARN